MSRFLLVFLIIVFLIIGFLIIVFLIIVFLIIGFLIIVFLIITIDTFTKPISTETTHIRTHLPYHHVCKMVYQCEYNSMDSSNHYRFTLWRKP